MSKLTGEQAVALTVDIVENGATVIESLTAAGLGGTLTDAELRVADVVEALTNASRFLGLVPGVSDGAAALTAAILSGLPVEALAALLVGWRDLRVNIGEGTVAIGAGVPVVLTDA